MSVRDHRRYRPKRVATWQLARSYCFTAEARHGDRKIPGPFLPCQVVWDVARWRLLTDIAGGASQPETLLSCPAFELPPGNSKAEAGTIAPRGGSGRP